MVHKTRCTRYTNTLTFSHATCHQMPPGATTLLMNGKSPSVVSSLKSIKFHQSLVSQAYIRMSPLCFGDETFISHQSSSRSLKAVTRKDDLWTWRRHKKRFRPLFFPFAVWSWGTSDAHLLNRKRKISLGWAWKKLLVCFLIELTRSRLRALTLLRFEAYFL